MDYSGSGLAMTESFESSRLTAYQDIAGVWTIGYGHTLGLQPGDVITQFQAEQYLLADMALAQKYVNTLVKVALTQGEYDALCDFAFNCGVGAFAGGCP